MRRPTVRALVLDGSAARRARYQQLLESSGDLQVVGVASRAEQAVELAARLQAHVLLAGPGASHEQALGWVRHIMQTRPLPIVVVCPPGIHEGDAHAFDLMAAGAVSVVREPANAQDGFADSELDLLQTLRLMSEVKVVRRWPRSGPELARAPAPAARLPRRRIDLVAIGASTGGPIVLKDVLCRLPASFPVPIVVVQHMAEGFVQGLADWLTASCAMPAEVAGPRIRLTPGRTYLAPDGLHMRLGADLTLAFDKGAPVNGHRPAVSCLFESVAARLGRHAVGVLLTGMGKDGAAELKQMKEAGAITIAQDLASSVVHGMPGEAIRAGAATYVMSPQELAAALPALVTK